MDEGEFKITIGDLDHLLNAIRITIHHGGSFLKSKLTPNGPVMRELNLNYIYKTVWGMFAAEVDVGIINRLLDWIRDKALQPNGDFFFPDEPPEYKDSLRLYRPLTFGKIAAWVGHPLIREELVLKRILQYQHGSGGVFHYVGDDPKNIIEPSFIGALNTSFFGHLMVALDMKDEALMAGDWLCRFVQANKQNICERGLMYTKMTPEGDLETNLEPGEKITGVVNNKASRQEFWQSGTAMAYLAVLYEKVLESWGYGQDKAQVYLDSALTLLDFEDTMPLDTYLWPSKCKVGWGCGELLRILVKYRKGAKEQVQKAYRVAKKVAVFTFIDNQLPNGGWSCMHYPLSELTPEIGFDYKPLKGLVNVPDSRIANSKSIFFPDVEIAGEFLGEMKSIQLGIEELLNNYNVREMAEKSKK
jgi:hypothetical protein